MEFYHQTVLAPSYPAHVAAAHLAPTSLKNPNRPQQLLTATTNALTIYQPARHPAATLSPLHRQEIFANITAITTIAYIHEDLRKDIIVLALHSGKYMLLEWVPESEHFSPLDSGPIFPAKHAQRTPAIATLLAVNTESSLLAMANPSWQLRLFSYKMGYRGLKLQPELYVAPSLPTICLSLEPGLSAPVLFHSLRNYRLEKEKEVHVHSIVRKGENQLEERDIAIEDSTAHMLIVRKGEGNFVVVGEDSLSSYWKGRLAVRKSLPTHKGLQATYFRRQRDRKEEVFLVNEYGELSVLVLDDNIEIVTAIFIEQITPLARMCMLDTNLFFGLATKRQSFLFGFSGRYKSEEKGERTRGSKSASKDFIEPSVSSHQLYREIEIISQMEGGRMFRDMKMLGQDKPTGG